MRVSGWVNICTNIHQQPETFLRRSYPSLWRPRREDVLNSMNRTNGSTSRYSVPSLPMVLHCIRLRAHFGLLGAAPARGA